MTIPVRRSRFSALLSSYGGDCYVSGGSSLFDSRSYCEPAQSAWESISGRPFAARPVDTHLSRRVLKPGGVGKLGPFSLPERLDENGGVR
jgi:hypothetical protein